MEKAIFFDSHNFDAHKTAEAGTPKMYLPLR
jgi:hypothetical protein